MEFVSLQPLIWLLIIIPLLAGLYFSLVERPAWLKFSAFAFRLLGIILLILAICRPSITNDSEDLHIVFILDVSESIDLDAARDSVDTIAKAIEQLKPNDTFSLFISANGFQEHSLESLKQLIDDWKNGIADAQFRSASKLGETLLTTRMAFPADKAQRSVVFSDGLETHTDLTQVVNTLKEDNIDIQFKKIDSIRAPEAAIVSIDPSRPFAFQGEVVRMTINTVSNQEIDAKLRIIHKGVAIAEEKIKLDPDGENQYHIDVEMKTPGASLWTAELIPEKDYFPINNQADTIVNVKGKSRVLILHEKTKEMRPFARALKEQGFEVDVRGKHGLPVSMEGLLAFNTIILANISATDMTTQQMTLLNRYVSDFAGGLAMFGSNNTYGLGGYHQTPVEEVLPLVSRFEKEKEKPSLAMALVIDKSGSMQGIPIALARQAAQGAVELLGQQDQIAVIGFDSSPHLITEMTSASDKGSINASIDMLVAGGGTYLYPAMTLAKEILEETAAKIKHMIILTDGQTQAADHEGLTQDMVDSGITVSAVALGQGAARELLATITEIGNGRYYETLDPTTVPQIFTKETMEASRSAIKEDLFTVIQTGDHPALSGFADSELPYSLGYVMTKAKPTAQLLLALETGDPLLAINRYGLGIGLAYTSDLTEQWGGEWLNWENCGKFWAQVLRSTMNTSDVQGLSTFTSINDNNWRIDITRKHENGDPVSKIKWKAEALDEYGKRLEVTINEIGLGRYHTSTPLHAHKKLTLRLQDEENDKLKILHYSRPYPPEYRLAKKLPQAWNATTPFSNDSHIKNITPVTHRKPITHIPLTAALFCLLTGIFLRRI